MVAVVVMVMVLLVVTVKVAEECPAVTVTLEGAVVAELLSDSPILISLDAGPLSVTVPVEEVPPVTLVGFSDTPVSVMTGVTVRAAVSVRPL